MFKGMMVAAVGFLFTLAGCNSIAPDEHDQMCPAIAAFANASKDSTVRSVELANDWGCNFDKSDNEGGFAMGCKACKHGDDTPSKQLCSYLMQNTSTEFPDGNFKRALDCLNTAYNFSARSPSSVERLSNRVFWSDHADFVKDRVVVGVEYLTNIKDSPEVLKISAKRR